MDGVLNGETSVFPGHWSTCPIVTVGLSDVNTYTPKYDQFNQEVSVEIDAVEYLADGTARAVPRVFLAISGSGDTQVAEGEVSVARWISTSDHLQVYTTGVYSGTAVTNITSEFHIKSNCYGLYRDGVYYRDYRIEMFYAATDGISPSGSVVLSTGHLPFYDDVFLTVTKDLPEGDYDIYFMVTTYATSSVQGDWMAITLYEKFQFLGSRISLGDGLAVYGGEVQLIAIGR